MSGGRGGPLSPRRQPLRTVRERVAWPATVMQMTNKSDSGGGCASPQAMPWLSDPPAIDPGLPIYTAPAIEPVAVSGRWSVPGGPADSPGQGSLRCRSGWLATNNGRAHRRQAGDPSRESPYRVLTPSGVEKRCTANEPTDMRAE